jgi:metallophosphoesterase (TIGR00282 family)
VIVLFIGDIVGAEATAHVAVALPELRRRHGADLVVANAENCAPSGLGMTSELVELLFASGVDVITGGNHSWDSPESVDMLSHPRVLRPHNLMAEVPGNGLVHLTAAGEPVTVLNLSDSHALRKTRAAAGMLIPAHHCWLAAERSGTVIVDLHGESVFEKQVFAHLVDGQAAAVLGTHTHEPTSPLYILPGGTAVVSDVGMTGPLGGVQGFTPGRLVTALLERDDHYALGIPPVVTGPIVVAAILLEIEDGRTRRVERLGPAVPTAVTWSRAAGASTTAG